MLKLYNQAKKIAEQEDVTTPADSLVLYSISFLPTTENKDKAFAWLKEHPQAMMIDQTPCGKRLIELGLLDRILPQEQEAEIWGIASKRLIAVAKGNVTAFVQGADARSVFRRQELPGLIANAEVKTINHLDKLIFAKQFAS